ncbi:hypothetical protein Kfla_3045 [Kribbella flavida DSM 17836]|uniref:Uncharacterized protein n=1 Tax=Kribbella flavida (strain DSM 17836 / JCM 10339 / NBRC 14399) TaxID=479435 RepID=D2Q2Y4_KRIFD|nr:hypothetical protein [Kribbella flavida]ADB32109.1 hypothetical protein Kfla_3045 [Kribbella flavida DSM 17836]
MPEVRTELLVEYVDQQTPDHAPPFTRVEAVVRRRRRRRNLLAVAAVVAVATAAVATTTDLGSDAEPAAPISTPTAGLLDDGPPPAQFTFGTTLMLLQGEIPVTAVRPSVESASLLVVEAARGSAAGEGCHPHTMVRILDQDATTVRIAAYRYVVAPDEPGSGECVRPETGPAQVQLDLRSPLGSRTVLAGSTGQRVVLN